MSFLAEEGRAYQVLLDNNYTIAQIAELCKCPVFRVTDAIEAFKYSTRQKELEARRQASLAVRERINAIKADMAYISTYTPERIQEVAIDIRNAINTFPSKTLKEICGLSNRTEEWAWRILSLDRLLKGKQ